MLYQWPSSKSRFYNPMKKYMSSSYKPQRTYYKKPFYKTKGFYILIAIILLVVIFVNWSINQSKNELNNEQKFSYQSDLPSLSGKVLLIEGKMDLKKPESNWEEINQNYEVQTSDYVRTGENSKAIIELLSNSTKCEEFGKSGYDLVNEFCNSEIMANNTLKIYHDLVNK